MKQKIPTVYDNMDKHYTYVAVKKKRNLALKNEFYLEAIFIDYAIIEDRLNSWLYHIAALNNRVDWNITKRNSVSPYLRKMVEDNKKRDTVTLSKKSITGKIDIIESVLKWSLSNSPRDELTKYEIALKEQIERQTDAYHYLTQLENLKEWLKYRNELIHALMHKSVDAIYKNIAEIEENGNMLGEYFDSEVRRIKKNNAIRRSVGLKTI